MKIHITNLYNFNKDDQLVQRQHKFAGAGRSLGVYEMGIFLYPVETDSSSELSKRLDGVIASLEANDVVIIQLPTGNGYKYEQLLFNKIKAYRGTKIVLLFHDMNVFSDEASTIEHDNYMYLCKKADIVVVPSKNEFARLQKEGISELLSLDDVNVAEHIVALNGIDEKYAKINECKTYKALCGDGFYAKKVLIDVMSKVYEQKEYVEKSLSTVSKNEIQIGFGLHDKTGSYSVWVGTAMQSIIEHTSSKICFHILIDDTVSDDNKNKLSKVATDGGYKICFHLIDKSKFEHLKKQVGQFIIGTMFRIMLPELLPDVSKIIYLDADIFVNRDIIELWNVNIENYYMAAVPDMGTSNGQAKTPPIRRGQVKADRYFNAGVLYINLNSIRKKGNMKEEVLAYLEYTKESILPDQDALNAIYNERTLLLDASWNYFAAFVRKEHEQNVKSAIYHFAGTRCILHSGTKMDQLYFETIERTPWGEETCRSLLDASLNRMNDRIVQLEKVINQISNSSPKRVFYGTETMAMKNMYKILNVQEGDYRVLGEPKEEHDSILPCKELSILQYEKREHIVFVLPEADNWTAINNLIQMGYVEEKDFFVIPKILDTTRGGYV